MSVPSDLRNQKSSPVSIKSNSDFKMIIFINKKNEAILTISLVHYCLYNHGEDFFIYIKQKLNNNT